MMNSLLKITDLGRIFRFTLKCTVCSAVSRNDEVLYSNQGILCSKTRNYKEFCIQNDEFRRLAASLRTLRTVRFYTKMMVFILKNDGLYTNNDGVYA